jgi:hypothetical protein
VVSFISSQKDPSDYLTHKEVIVKHFQTVEDIVAEDESQNQQLAKNDDIVTNNEVIADESSGVGNAGHLFEYSNGKSDNLQSQAGHGLNFIQYGSGEKYLKVDFDPSQEKSSQMEISGSSAAQVRYFIPTISNRLSCPESLDTKSPSVKGGRLRISMPSESPFSMNTQFNQIVYSQTSRKSSEM